MVLFSGMNFATLNQVEAALTTDPDNEELVKLQSDLKVGCPWRNWLDN